MKIEDYIKSLPEKIITGEDVQLSASTLREILEFADIGEKDVFYHLGCGDGAVVLQLPHKYGARAIGLMQIQKKHSKDAAVAIQEYYPVALFYTRNGRICVQTQFFLLLNFLLNLH